MTREEAIKVINNHLEHWKRLVRGKVCDEIEGAETISAFEVAIQALSQEPCEDAISREAVLSIIDGWHGQNRETENIEDLKILITYMDSVMQKSGKWIPVSERLPDEYGE